MADYENAVFISYAWGIEREDIVNQVDRALQDRGIEIIRDKRELGYKGSINAFMERIGRGDCVILVISDKYLRSPNCMYELVEIAENKNFQDRVFPIVLGDANIYDPVQRIQYIKHWEEKRAELAKAILTLDPANLQGIREEIDLYDRIRDKVSGLTSILKDMNTLTPEMHSASDFEALYATIESRLRLSSAAEVGESQKKKVPEKEEPVKKETPQALAEKGKTGLPQNVKIGLFASVGLVLLSGLVWLIRGNTPASPDATATVALTATSVPTEIAAAPLVPPAEAQRGDVWVRPEDEMTMSYIPAGDFEMVVKTVANMRNPSTRSIWTAFGSIKLK